MDPPLTDEPPQAARDRASSRCPSEEDLARWLAGAMDRTVREEVLSHLDACADCRELAVTLARGGPARHLEPRVAPAGRFAKNRGPR